MGQDDVPAHRRAAVPVPGRVPRRGARHGAVRPRVGAVLQQPAVPVRRRASGCERAAERVAAVDGRLAGVDRVPGAANSGFVDADTRASQVLPMVEGAANYGGIMLWSRSYDKDSSFSVKLQAALQNRNKPTGTTLLVLLILRGATLYSQQIPKSDNARVRPQTTFRVDGINENGD